jgi:hypothetical protein
MKIAATTLAGFITVEERRAKKDIIFWHIKQYVKACRYVIKGRFTN